MFVVNFTPAVAPKPSCCGDPNTMCAKCAYQALANESNLNRPLPYEPEYYLPEFQPQAPRKVRTHLIPETLNYQAEYASQAGHAPTQSQHPATPGKRTPLVPLTINYAEEAKAQVAVNESQTRPRSTPGKRAPLIPLTINYAEELQRERQKAH